MKSSNVIYLGHKKIYSDLCQSIRVLFYHHIEGLSRTLLEAGAQGIPAITSNVPGCNDIIQNKVNGLLCRPRSTESLIKSINLFLKMYYITQKHCTKPMK